MKRGVAAIAVWAWSATVWAQTAPASAPPPSYTPPAYPVLVPPIAPAGTLPLELEGSRDDLRMVLSAGEGERPFVRCFGRCALALEPGSYTLTVGATRDTPEGSREFLLENPARMKVAPSERSTHPLETAGFAMVLAGCTAIGLGFAVDDDPSSDNLFTSRDGMLLGGMVSLGSGVILFVIGSSIGPSAKPDVEIEPL